ncbi:hypothetical protein [Nocardia heshunensis]
MKYLLSRVLRSLSVSSSVPVGAFGSVGTTVTDYEQDVRLRTNSLSSELDTFKDNVSAAITHFQQTEAEGSAAVRNSSNPSPPNDPATLPPNPLPLPPVGTPTGPAASVPAKS